MKTSLVYFFCFIVIISIENINLVLNNEKINSIPDSIDKEKNDSLKIDEDAYKELNSSDLKNLSIMPENNQNHIGDIEKLEKGIYRNFI